MAQKKQIIKLYERLISIYGRQGWWPIVIATNQVDGSESLCSGYHPNNYQYPQNDTQRLEICLGAILTQNTQWKNVLTSLTSLNTAGLFTINRLDNAKTVDIALAIRSAGYYNQKAHYIKNFISFIKENPFQQLDRQTVTPLRDKLLSIKGIGPETADCILLYALKKCSFVVDTYTKRFLGSLKLIGNNGGYDEIKEIFESSLSRNLEVFQEYHALLVEHGKHHYRKKPYGVNDPIRL